MDIKRNITNLYKIAVQIVKDGIIKRLPVYHKSIKTLPVANWFELKDGKFHALYKYEYFKHIPLFFGEISNNMIYEFDNLDLTLLRKKADLALLNSIAARTQNKSVQFKADSLKKEIIEKELKQGQDISLNAFIDYIELTFNTVGQINPLKLSTSRAFSLFHQAIQKNKVKK